MNVAEGEEMCAAVEKANVANMVWYNYRRVPAVTHAKEYHRRVVSWVASTITGPTSFRTGRLPRMSLRVEPPHGDLMSNAAGSGVTGDLLAHCIDTAIWLNGSDQRSQRDDRNICQGTNARGDWDNSKK